MTAASRWAFFIQVLLILVATGGWAAFAGAYSRSRDAEARMRDAEDSLVIALDANKEMQAAEEKMLDSKNSLIRILELKNQQLQQQVQTYEVRLRQLGIIQ